MSESKIIFSLDTPKYHLLRSDNFNAFSGFVFDYRSKPVASLNVHCDGKYVGDFQVNLPSQDIFKVVPHIASARNCRFKFDLYINPDASQYSLNATYEDSEIARAIIYDLTEVRSQQAWFQELGVPLNDMEVPPGELVLLTQGINDRIAYRDSIIPGIYNMKRYLAEAGVDPAQLQSVLDIGCGTARLLTGWYLDNPKRRLFGCDINTTLIEWNRKHLPEEMVFFQNEVLPPLPYPDESFDLIYLVSVFTHLSLDTQRLWIEEARRLLKAQGILFITLHGGIYVEVAKPSLTGRFLENGYCELANEDEGSSTFNTFHRPDFVRRLFSSFDLLAHYPRGNDVLFPVAAFQDAYVFRKP
jgi:SAM-dependent methyltransferase